MNDGQIGIGIGREDALVRRRGRQQSEVAQLRSEVAELTRRLADLERRAGPLINLHTKLR